MSQKGAPPSPAPTGLDVYHWMVLARELDRVLCDLNPRWFPCFGEEAVIVGSFVDLRNTDVAAVHYRDPFVVYAMRGAELPRLVAQVLGRVTGYSAGRAVPFTGPATAGIVPWVAGDLGTSLGVATGAAVALQMRGGDDVCVCTFGDGTANRGDFHEAANLAATWKLPIVYICQNNGWAISQRSSTYLAAPVHERGAGYGMPGELVDGQDVQAVRAAVTRAVARARGGGGPSLVEARTRRGRGHWAGDDQNYRLDADDKYPDPLEVYAETLVRDGTDRSALLRERDVVAALVTDAVKEASAAAVASLDDLGVSEVYR